MRLMFEPGLTALIELIRAELDSGQALYIVGGAVRDLLLNRELHDLDFVMADNPTDLAKSLARRLKVGFFVLDDKRHTARVVYYDQHGNQFPLDFVQYTGGSLDEDLYHRDFTINAMAIPVDDLTQMIDPLGGQVDLERRLLRACSDRAMVDDPVRVLRGARLAVQFDFNFAPGLEAAMQKAAAHLPKVSYERQRDEFFRLLAGPDPAEGLQYCRSLRVFETMLPPLVDLEAIPVTPPHQLGLIEHSIQTVAHYFRLFNLLSKGWRYPGEIDWTLRDVLNDLEQFSEGIYTFFSKVVTPGRTKAELAYFGALLHDVGKPLTLKEGVDENFKHNDHALVGAEVAWEMTRRLQLSNAESAWVQKLVRHHMDLLPLVNNGLIPNRRQIYRFFRETGEVGVAVALHILADTLATYGETLDPKRWTDAISVVRVLFSAWFNNHDTMIKPSPMLDGHDLQQRYGLKPGKQIGSLLTQLVEEQASGTITSTDEAHNFIRKQLSRSSR